MKFSIIVPTYNEAHDIARTLDLLERLEYPDYEVIVVDDGSQDQTVPIIQTYVRRLKHFHLLAQSDNRGVAFARNLGIRTAKGEVVVILNADVLLPSDFLQRIFPYYKQGKQWVSVVSRVENQDRVYSRFTDCEAYHYHGVRKIPWLWSEGFSCTKQAALDVGLFPEAMPGCSGEDVKFGLDLKKRFNGVQTTEVVVSHVAPDRLIAYWRQQKGRGKGRTHVNYYLRGQSRALLFMNSFLATLWRIFKMLIGIPVLNAWQYASCSSRKKRDFIPFIFVAYLKDAAMLSGIWAAYRRIFRSENSKLNR